MSFITKVINMPGFNGFQKYAKNAGWLFLERGIRLLAGFFIGILIARHLGPDQYGVFNYIVSFVALFASISSLGVDVILVRELVKHENKLNELMGTAFVLKLIGAIASIILIIIFSFIFSNDTNTKFMIIIVASATMFSSFNVIDLYFQAKVISKYSVFANIIMLVLSSIIKIYLLINNANLIAFIWVVLFDSIFLAIGFLYFYMQRDSKVKNWLFKSNLAIELLRDSWPLILSGVAITIYMRVDQIMIKEMLDFNAVGQYAAAVKISEGWYFIPMLIGASLAPAIINAKEVNENLYYTRLQNFYTAMVWGAILISVPLAIFADLIINTLFGSSYSEAASVLVIHVWAGIFLSLGIACGKWYLAENYTKGALYKALFGMSINIVGNYFLIPIYGINGAAFSTLIAHISANLIYDFIDPRVRGQLKYKIKAFFPYYLLKGNQFVK
ncbi:flippase [Gammaproteobacteria bacterium]|nr:flippase [Gammaproteobacteria bacterium]